MNTKIRLLSLAALLLATPLTAETRGGVWVYQPEGNSYRIENRHPQYDPRSPYPQHRQYPQNLPPRYQGQLPPRHYDNYPRQDRYEERYRDRFQDRQPRWDARQRHGYDQRPRWQHDHRLEERRAPVIRGRGYRLEGRDEPRHRPERDRRGSHW
jgi:hypothetical protein